MYDIIFWFRHHIVNLASRNHLITRNIFHTLLLNSRRVALEHLSYIRPWFLITRRGFISFEFSWFYFYLFFKPMTHSHLELSSFFDLIWDIVCSILRSWALLFLVYGIFLLFLFLFVFVFLLNLFLYMSVFANDICTSSSNKSSKVMLISSGVTPSMASRAFSFVS